jgi:serine O-acetyltransferase
VILNKVEQSFLKELSKAHREHNRNWPDRKLSYDFLRRIFELFFPHFHEKQSGNLKELTTAFEQLGSIIRHILTPLKETLSKPVDQISQDFLAQMPTLHQDIWNDAVAIFKGDPAANSVDEVILAYPGFYAIAVYRIAHLFYNDDIPIFPRILTEHAHQITGIDIHPGAKIGASFCIDHGTGVVIGETTVIGTNVKLYQGVTLGALSVEKQLANTKRHPTIEDNCIIYAQATILGGSTIVGHNSIIGGNVWLTESVAPYSTVYHQPEISVKPTRTKST